MNFTTFFDKNYLSRGLILFDSLKEQDVDFKFFVLCLDQETFDFLNRFKEKNPQVETLTLNDLEEHDPTLLICKNNRSLVEYYFTLSPCLPLYLLEKYQLNHICSLDADMLFLSSPQPIFDYLNDYSIIITPHKFSKETAKDIIYGVYNVSFQIFKNDETGVSCLKKWKEQCMDWCKDELDQVNQRFADQLYLNDWPKLYPNQVKELNDEVSGLAPWNINNYTIENRLGTFYSNHKRIIFYHFHHFKILEKHWAINGFYTYKINPQPDLIKLYQIYWSKIEQYNMKFDFIVGVSQRYNYNKKKYKILHEEKSIFMKKDNEITLVSYNLVPRFVLKIFSKFYAKAN